MYNTRVKSFFIIIFSFVIATIVSLGTFFSGLTSVAFADVKEGVDTSYVMDDLEGLNIDGREFDVSNYPFDKNKELEVLTFVEYGYSNDAKYQSIFGLYIYLYNPQGLSFQYTSRLNEITLSIDSANSSTFKSYKLKYVSRSLNADIKDLFLKFRIDLTSSEINAIRENLSSSSKRVYSIGEVELLKAGDYLATSFPAGNVYTYAGFGQGLDDTSKNGSTLTCITNGLQVISPKVGLTSYSLSGANGTNSYTHDMIYTAYFSVPNELIRKYGAIYSMSGEYLDATLKPALVTGSEEAFRDLYPFLGENLTADSHPSDHAFLAFEKTWGLNEEGLWRLQYSGYTYNSEAWPGSSTIPSCNPLYLLFKANLTEENINYFSLSSSEIYDFMLSTSNRDDYSDELILDRYSKDIFTYVADEKSEFRIFADKNLELTNIELSQNFLQRWFGGYTSVNTSVKFDNIKAIQEVDASDFLGKEVFEICDNLKISENDYLDFKSAFDEAQENDETLYLFRYRVAPYSAIQAKRHYKNFFGSFEATIDKANYFFQMSVSLDFDVIDVSFKADDIETFIPVAVSPMDHVPNASGPVDVGGGDLDKAIDYIKMIFIIILVVICLLLLSKMGLLTPVLKGIGYIILSPYYLIKWIFSDGSNNKRYKKKRR